MVKQRKYVVKKYFQGVPKRDDFEVVETELPSIKDGEVLVKTEWISVDPYQRAYNNQFQVPYDQFGFQIGLVLESKDARYPEGSRIISHRGWCDYSVINPSVVPTMRDVVYLLPDLKGLPNSLGVGAIGMPGATAYFGFLEICQPKAGETVVVTGAAGAVGSLVGQIAKIKGCKVIGFAGSDDKVEWLEKDLGFDKAFNYKTVDVIQALKEAAPQGVDCYFDNVGGEISSQIISQMNMYGRVSVCGSISAYSGVACHLGAWGGRPILPPPFYSAYNNETPTEPPKASIIQMSLVSKELKVEGFRVYRWQSRWGEAFADLVKWTKAGQLKTREHVTEGFDKMYDAFVGMLAGENSGKAVVKV